MRKPRCDGQETRQRLLDAAARVFAAKGFWEATTSEICRAAQTNAASVNYYFNSKESLYVESWRHTFEQSLETHPPDGGIPADASPEERLEGRIRSLMHRIIDEDSYSFDIVHKEMANPTGLLSDVMRSSIDPIREGMAAIVRELLGDAATDENVRLCRMSIISQCFGPMLRQRRQNKEDKAFPVEKQPDLDTLAQHVVKFSLAGIHSIRDY